MRHVGNIIRASTYKQKLQSSEWRKFASRVKQQHNFCAYCKQGDKPTQVHHLFYEPDREPWEYGTDEVLVLCAECHSKIHERLQQFRKYVFRYLTPDLFQILNGALAVGLTVYNPSIYLHALAEFTGNERLVNNHTKAYGFENARSNKFPSKPEQAAEKHMQQLQP